MSRPPWHQPKHVTESSMSKCGDTLLSSTSSTQQRNEQSWPRWVFRMRIARVTVTCAGLLVVDPLRLTASSYAESGAVVDFKVGFSFGILYSTSLIITGVWSQMWTITVILTTMFLNLCAIMARNMVNGMTGIIAKLFRWLGALHSRLQHCIPRVPCYRAYAMEYSARVQTHAPRSDEAFSRNQRLAVAVCHGW